MAAFPYPPNSTTYDPTSPYNVKEQTRIGRTPSPTPSENKAMKSGVLDLEEHDELEVLFRRECYVSYQSFPTKYPSSECHISGYYVALVIILVLTGLMTIYHTQIVNWLTPATRWLHE